MAQRTFNLKLGEERKTLQFEINENPPNFRKLHESIMQLYGINPANQVLKLRYVDEDEDLITISSNWELQEALNTLPGAIEMNLLAVPPLFTQSQATQEAPLPTYDDFLKNHASGSSSPSSSSAARPASDELPPYDHPVNPPPEKPELFDFDHLANEFHFHRLIIQTAVESALQSLQEKYKTSSSSSSSSSTATPSREADFLDFLSEVGRDIRNTLRNQDITRRISEGFEEFGTFAEPFLHGIRDSFLEFLATALPVEQAAISAPSENGRGKEREGSTQTLSQQQQQDEEEEEEEEEEEVPRRNASTAATEDEEEREEETSNDEKEREEETSNDTAAEDEEEEGKRQQETIAVQTESETPTLQENQTQTESQPEQFIQRFDSGDSYESFVMLEAGETTPKSQQQEHEREEEAEEIDMDSTFEFVDELQQLEEIGSWENDVMKAALVSANGDLNQALDSLVN